MTVVTSANLPGTSIDPRYPDSDGRFMGDTDFHNTAMTEIKERLQDYFAGDEDVYIASNLILYWKEGDPRSRRDPDILVAKGVKGKHPRRSFRVWEEKVLPRVLFEIVSKKTWRNDVGDKRILYAKIGIKEYFLFDPEGLYIDPPLQGFRSVRGKSVPIEYERGAVHSKELGLYFYVEGAFLHIVDVATDQPLLTRSARAEQTDQLRAQIESLHGRLESEKERAEVLQRMVEMLQARLDENTNIIAEFTKRIGKLEEK